MRTETSTVAKLLFGQTRSRILRLLYGFPDESFFVRQLAREVATSVGSVQRELALLSGAGLIERSVLGSQVFYRANRRHPVFPELRALLAKTVGLFAGLQQALAPLAARIRFSFVYGSVARGEEQATSDIDLMVIGDVSLEEVLDAVSLLEKEVRRPVNPTVYSLDEFRRRLDAGNHFLRALENQKKVFVIGTESEFREAIATGLVQG